MARLVVCESCLRHVHATEQTCPFCDGEVRVRPAEPVVAGLSRAAQYALGAAIAATSAGCKDEAPATRSPTDAVPASVSASASPMASAPAPSASTQATAAAVPSSTAAPSASVIATSSASAAPVASAAPGFACGNTKCGGKQWCYHPCSGCGGQAARMGNCGPGPQPQCTNSGAQGPNDHVQGRDVYAFCPPMPYGCVFPDGCGAVTV